METIHNDSIFETRYGKLVFQGYNIFRQVVDGFDNDVGWGCTIRSFQMMYNRFRLKSADFIVPCIETVLEKSKEFGGIPGEWYSQSIVCKTMASIVDDISFGSVPVNFPCLAVVVTRLDVGRQLTDRSKDILQRFFASSHQIGLVGGKQNSCYYLVAYNGHRMHYVDPHKMLKNDCLQQMEVEALDPCVTFGWMCKDQLELNAVKEEFRDLFDSSCLNELQSSDFQVLEEDDLCIIDM